MKERKIDLIGKRFGKWIVMSYEGLNKSHHEIYKCKCDCGNEKLVRGCTLLNGESKSCGCYRSRKKCIVSGLSTQLIYKVWDSMVRRCNDTKNTHYNQYGGRGIKVCEEWKGDPISFVKWANSNGYEKGLSIDRINNDGDYESNNCRFVTPREQAHNTRRNVWITVNGETRILSEWADITGLDHRTIGRRYNRGIRGDKLFNKTRVG